MPLNKYTSLMKLLRDLDTPHIELLSVDKRTYHDSYKAALDILDAMSKHIDQEVSKKAKESPGITILTDE